MRRHHVFMITPYDVDKFNRESIACYKCKEPLELGQICVRHPRARYVAHFHKACYDKMYY